MQIGAEASDFICASLLWDLAVSCSPDHKARETLATLHANSGYALGVKLARLHPRSAGYGIYELRFVITIRFHLRTG